MNKILFIDVETGGLDAAKQSILTFGACIWPFEPGSFNTCIEFAIRENDIIVENEAMNVNKIDLENIKKYGMSPDTAVHHLYGWLRNHFDMKSSITLGGYNAQFDVSMLKRLFRLANREDIVSERASIFGHRIVDLASIARFLKDAGKIPCEPKSNLVFEHFNCTPLIPHTALHDAIAAACCYDKMLKLLSPPAVASTFGERYARFCGMVDGPSDLSGQHVYYRL